MAELERLLAIVKTEEMSENEVGEELLARASSLLAQLRKLERAQKVAVKYDFGVIVIGMANEQKTVDHNFL